MGSTPAEFITFLGTLVTASIKWIGEVLDFAASEPIILIPTLVFFIAGGAIGLFNRIIRG